MYTLNEWWFLSSGGSYPLVFTVDTSTKVHRIYQNRPISVYVLFMLL